MSKFFKALQQAERERVLRAGEERPPTTLPGDLQPEAVEPATPSTEVIPDRPPDFIGELAGEVEPHLVSLLTPASFAAEQYRSLRYLIEQARRSAGLQVMAVTSPTVGDGKTTTAINLAGALAQSPETRVLILDADLRRSSVARHLGLEDPDHLGLVDAILDPGIEFDRLVRPCPPFNVSVLPAGRVPDAPYELLKSPRFLEIVEEARRRYDYVVLDTPPAVPVPDCRVITKWVDGYILVVKAHKTPRKLLEETLNLMDPEKIVGLLFNSDDRPFSGHYRYGAYGYGHPYGAETDGKRKRWLRRAMNRFGNGHKPRQGGR
jgi:capsular exopolysaccharide synthesis family protein